MHTRGWGELCGSFILGPSWTLCDPNKSWGPLMRLRLISIRATSLGFVWTLDPKRRFPKGFGCLTTRTPFLPTGDVTDGRNGLGGVGYIPLIRQKRSEVPGLLNRGLTKTSSF